MKQIANYKEVMAVLSMFYTEDQVQLTYAHPYEFPYVISVLVEKLKDFDVRVVQDMNTMYGLEVDTKHLGKKVLLCFYQK